MSVWAGGTECARFNTGGGTLDLNTTLSENAFSLDDALVKENKWDYLTQINESFKHHDGRLLPAPLRIESTWGKGKKKVTKYGKKPSDLIQVNVSCILDLQRRIVYLEEKEKGREI